MSETSYDSYETKPSRSERRRETVLLVDDDGRLLQGLLRSFADEQYEVLTAISAAEANVVLSRRHVDLVLSDNLMPGVLGAEFLAEVRKQHPEIKLMMLSGYMPPAAAQRAVKDLGILKVLTKPSQAREVAAAIREVLAK